MVDIKNSASYKSEREKLLAELEVDQVSGAGGKRWHIKGECCGPGTCYPGILECCPTLPGCTYGICVDVGTCPP